MEREISKFEVFSEDSDHITFKGMNEDGICIGLVSVSLKFRGWMLGCCSHFHSSHGLTEVSANGRGWKSRLVEEAKNGLQYALR
jgi:hypothetical protein